MYIKSTCISSPAKNYQTSRHSGQYLNMMTSYALLDCQALAFRSVDVEHLNVRL